MLNALFAFWTIAVRILHYNDEETELHHYLAERGHENVILSADDDPFAEIERSSFDAAFVGLHPHGLDLLSRLRDHNPHCFVTIITSDQTTRMAVESMKRGAFDYLLSPLDFGEVERTIIMLSREFDMVQRQRSLESELAEAVGEGQLLGSSEVVRDLRRLIQKAAMSQAPVLITGETGTGKELVARLLHEQSSRHHHPLVSVNCNAIPSTLLESELFGYRRGAFTGADMDREGLLAAASGGTFFFDEVSDLEPLMQGKILRVLQQGEVMPLGTTVPKPLNVRFVAATNQELSQLVYRGVFREDLYYRLNVVPISVPPLRARPEDIPELTRHFLRRYCDRDGRSELRVTPEVWEWLLQHHWPGNIRELENLCQRAVALAESDQFDTGVLSLSESISNRRPLPSGSTTTAKGKYEAQRGLLERQMIEQALAEAGGVKARAAKALGISRTTLYAKLRELELS